MELRIQNEELILHSTFLTLNLLERVTGIEPVSLPWQGNIITIIRYPRMNLELRVMN